MPNVHAFHVVPALPESLDRLRALAHNLRWSWDHETVELFRRLDRDLWEASGHNPVRMLGTISQDRLRELAADDAFLADVDRIHYSLETYLRAGSTWYKRNHAAKLPPETSIAYFSMEFGLTECLPIYSGGLGVLAGDHLKSASDLGLPLVGVGLLYQQGYFRQYLNTDGWQQERYPDNDFYNMPIQPERDERGEPIRIWVELPGRNVYAQVWRVQVGRIPLYLLDTNIDVNNEDDQNITDQLYGGNAEMRLKQEMVLGIGGMRALAALKIEPTLCHMNEGHSAFLSLERTRMLMRETGADFAHAVEVTAAGSLFTTHTPVPAGFDFFSADLLGRYFDPYISQLGISFDDFMSMGRINRWDQGEQFNMALLALHNTHHVNGVSKLHGRVTRRMVQSAYQGFPLDEVPVTSVTNGVHTRSYVSQEMADLLDRYLGGRWSQDVSDAAVWSHVDDIPDEEIWRIKQRRRERLVLFARNRLRIQYEQRNRSSYELRKAREVLNPDALTIGFARRFATYKRATLILSDPDRLIRLLTDSQRPVQILLAGKAHPRDDGGKELIRQIFQFAQRPEVRNSIVFLEDYDLVVARYLVQGVDIWLNTPRRPMEASGTSGMKVLANGGLNASIPDGWWAEGYDPRVGWSIGKGEEYADPDEQDRMEASALYDLLEKEVMPLFYDRSTTGIPLGWLTRVKNSMRTLCPVFNTNRMVSEYAERFYFPATLRYRQLRQDNMERARQLVDWKLRLRDRWPQVRIESVNAQNGQDGQNPAVGSAVQVATQVRLGGLEPGDITVQAYHGPLDADHQITQGETTTLECKSADNGVCHYEGEIPLNNSGLQGFSVRVVPTHPDAQLPQELPLITWE
jgi:starch phosphorylase